MKELRKYFEHYTYIYPELSSFMCFGKACKQTKPNKRQVREGFREMVDRHDYSKSDITQLFEHLYNMAQQSGR